MPIALQDLATALYVDPADVRVLLDMIEPGHGEDLPDYIAGEVRMVLNPWHERTLPQLWSQAAMDDWRDENNINKPDGDNHAPGGYTVQVNLPGPDKAERDPRSCGEDYYGGDYLQDVAEARLLELGGPELLEAAHDSAAASADALHPWDGAGSEPEGRVSEYISVLWRWVNLKEKD